MSWLYRHLFRPALFAQDPERVHERTLRALGWAGRHRLLCDALDAFFGAPPLPVDVFGLRFPNPVGLAAGMDKEAEALPAWAALGFGFTELGAVTWHAQPGNPSPRLFRAIPEEAIVNRMGFNNSGADVVVRTLAQWRLRGFWPPHPVGMNLGKSKVTPLDQAPEDYANSFRLLRPHLDFFVVNVSSPNTPNLRQLQDKSALDEILAAIQQVQAQATSASQTEEGGPEGQVAERKAENSSLGPSANPSAAAIAPDKSLPSQASIRSPRPPLPPKPILVKVAPDLSFEALDEILELAGPRQLAGIVATNTTITRPQTGDPAVQRIYAETGGLSGRPLRARSTEIIRHLYRQTRGRLPIIGVGGIFSAADAWEKIAAGASLVQLYTGLVYEGPWLVRDIVRGLNARLLQSGMTFGKLIGVEAGK